MLINEAFKCDVCVIVCVDFILKIPQNGPLLTADAFSLIEGSIVVANSLGYKFVVVQPELKVQPLKSV